MIGGERGAGGQWPERAGVGEMRGDPARHPLDHAPRGDEAIGQGPREGGVLPRRDEPGPQVVAAEPRGDRGGIGVPQLVGERQIGAREDALPAQEDRFAAVHRGHGALHLVGQRGLTDQRELGIEHDAGRSASGARRRGVEPDAALRPDRGVDRHQQPLEQHEGGLLAHPPAALGSGGEDRVRASGQRRACLGERDRPRQHPAPAPPPEIGARFGDHELHRRGKLVGIGLETRMHAHAEAGHGARGDARQRVASDHRVPAEIERAERAAAAHRQGETRIRSMKWGYAQDNREQWSPPDVDSTLRKERKSWASGKLRRPATGFKLERLSPALQRRLRRLGDELFDPLEGHGRVGDPQRVEVAPGPAERHDADAGP